MRTRAKSKIAKRGSSKAADARTQKSAERHKPASSRNTELPKADVLDLARYEIGTRLRHARLEVVAGCGHCVDMEKPAELVRLVTTFCNRG